MKHAQKPKHADSIAFTSVSVAKTALMNLAVFSSIIVCIAICVVVTVITFDTVKLFEFKKKKEKCYTEQSAHIWDQYKLKEIFQ